MLKYSVQNLNITSHYSISLNNKTTKTDLSLVMNRVNNIQYCLKIKKRLNKIHFKGYKMGCNV